MEPDAMRTPTRGMYTYMIFVACWVHVLASGVVYWASLQEGAPAFLGTSPWLGPLIIMLLLPIDVGVLMFLRSRAPAGPIRQPAEP